MSEGMTKLKSIGAQKIHEQTHIARHHAQAIIHESFDDMNKIQFLGFVSILEREYSLNLDELRLIAEEHYSEENSNTQETPKVFVTPKRKKRYTLVYLAVAAIVFVIAVLVNMDNSSLSLKVKTEPLNNEAIDNAKVNMQIADTEVTFEVVDENTTLNMDENLTSSELNVTVEEIIPAVIVEKSFKIIADTKLWLGYMDIDTRAKKQKIFTGDFDLDPKKDWLLSLGHGYVNVEIDGEVTEFKSKYNMKLLYKNANITKITFKKYKEINRGSKW